MILRPTHLFAAGAAAGLAACGEMGATGAPPPAPMPAPSPAPALESLGPDDVAQARLAGELGCGFRRSPTGPTLFLGSADVMPTAGGDGVVKVDCRLRRLSMQGTGGFSGLSDGAVLTGDGLTVTIEVTGREPLTDASPEAAESPPYPARITVRGAGASSGIDGVYACGA